VKKGEREGRFPGGRKGGGKKTLFKLSSPYSHMRGKRVKKKKKEGKGGCCGGVLQKSL